MDQSSGAEKINPYRDDVRSKTEQVKDMFDNIAPAYDFMNRMMTLGIDKLWRRRAVNMLRARRPRHILDVATGTGDLALLLGRRLHPDTLTGIDLSGNMIEIARRKAASVSDVQTRYDFQVADCLSLPFADATFDCVTVAYGVRNFERLLDGYREMYRVMKHGGTLCVIELSTPVNRLVWPLYNLYTRRVIPLVGRFVSRDVRAYSYLPESIEAVAQGPEMTSLMERAGFAAATFRRLTFGVCTIYLATR